MARSCDWCASTAINRTEDGMIWLCGNPGHDHPFGVIFVPLHWNDPSGKFPSTAKGEMPITISGALSEGQYPKHSLSVDGGHEVPYVQMVDVTEGWKHQPASSDLKAWRDETQRSGGTRSSAASESST